ncbi:MAG: S9 family peptidase [Chitinophagaceae bacterium]
MKLQSLCLAILCCVFSTSVSAQNKSITLEDIWSKPTFRQDFVAGFRSMKDGIHYTESDAQGNLVRVRFQDGQRVDTLVNLKKLNYKGKNLAIGDYAFDANEQQLLLFTESESIYRRSAKHMTYLYNLATKEVTQIRDEKILHPEISPRGDKVAYVFDNNMYVFDIATKKTSTITTNGDYNHINGNCDWVYEEEFEFTQAYVWGADGDYLVYYHFDQTAVPEYQFAMYDGIYPSQYKYKYPKAGEPNSVVSVYTYLIPSGKTVSMNVGPERDQYIPRIKINAFNKTPIIYRMNRLQNKLELLEGNPQTGETRVVYTETNDKYVEVHDHIQFLTRKNAFIILSEKSGYNHLYYHDMTKNETKPITSGNWEVVSMAGVDESKQSLIYVSAERSPMERQVYKIGINGKNKTCLTPETGWHDVSFSNNFSYYLDKHSAVNQPPTYTLYGPNTKRLLKDNAGLRKTMREYTLATQELIQIPNAEGTILNAWMIKPANFVSTKKYPVLMFQYSGPGSQQVTNQFSGRDFWWYQMLAEKGYIIVCADGTGTGFRGEAFKKKTYLQLGKYESDDQIAVANYLGKQSYVDASRIGIWGWSFGGYMSSICLLKGADVFKMAIAVAPVTNWRYYDNIYTERYMRTPKENAAGYDDNSPVNMVKNLKGKYFLIHGTADDNVHYQNAIEMQQALIDADKPFDSEAYPDKNHGIGGGVTRLHLYRRLTKYILENL